MHLGDLWFVESLNANYWMDNVDQVLRVLDYSRISRHLLVTAGDDGSIHMWDTTGRNPKVCAFCYKLLRISFLIHLGIFFFFPFLFSLLIRL